MKKFWLTAMMGLLTLGLLTQGTALASIILDISPEADAYVNANLYTTNYGTNALLNVGRSGGSYTRNSYLKFDLSGLSGIKAADLLSATLYLDLVDRPKATPVNYRVPMSLSHVDNDAWLESTITSNNQPTRGSTMYTTPSNLPLGWVAFNLLSLGNSWVAGDLIDGELSVTLWATSGTGTYTPNTDYKFYSRDYADAALRPYLRVEYNPVPVPPSALLLGSGLLGLVGFRFRKS